MKQLFLFSTLILLCACSRQWYKTPWLSSLAEYPYVYCFDFGHESKRAFHSVERLVGTDSSLFKVENTDGEVAVLVPIVVQGISLDTVFVVQTNFDGEANIYLEPGKYEFQFGGGQYDASICKEVIGNNEFINLDVVLMPVSPPMIYEIHSKSKLPKSKLKEIIKCVSENRSSAVFSEACSLKGEWLLMMQI